MVDAGLLDSALENNTKFSGQLTHRITYKSIIQARQEMPLVRMQLERHIRGDDSPYVLQDQHTDTTVGGKIPAHYYQETPCCQNCFQVYSIVDKARNKALSQLSTLRARANSKTDANSAGSMTSEDAKDFLESKLTSFQSQALSNISQSKRKKREKISFDEPSADSHASSAPPPPDRESMREAQRAIESLTKMDVAEIRTMVKPPAAVEVVMEAVMILLTGKQMPFKETHRLLNGGEAFLSMLKDFNLDDVTEDRLRMMEVYVDNPLFRPENVLSISRCASKFCAWVHGIVHAARYQRGMGHKRIDTIKSKALAPLDPGSLSQAVSKNYLKPLSKPTSIAAPNRQPLSSAAAAAAGHGEELSFVQKLERIKATKMKDSGAGRQGRGEGDASSSLGPLKGTLKKSQSLTKKGFFGSELEASMAEPSLSHSLKEESMLRSTQGSRFDPGPTPTLPDFSMSSSVDTMTGLDTKKKYSKRELKAMKAMQKKNTERLAAQTSMEGSVGIMGVSKEFVCSDGISRMPYVVMGKFSLTVEKCNFVVIHDFFDTYDGTAILFKPIVQRHEEGCQVLCFNYPGQAHTVWPRPSPVERDRGAKEPVLNNDWLADRIHELLTSAEAAGDILLSKPFHLVGIGNGSCIAAAFCQRYASHKMYANSLRSVVSINGFLYPDAQLSAILHAAHQIFESTPHSRPDIAVSYWSRFIFSEEYLARVNPNLALNIYTAVSNPITNDGRVKLTRGSLHHRDMRGGLSPDFMMRGQQPLASQQSQSASSSNPLNLHDRFQPVQVPVIVLQSTEDMLVSASNVDSFLIGRTSKHLWSHMLNVPSSAMMSKAFDVNAQWVGRMSTSPEDYPLFSTLGRTGLRMLLDSLRSPKGAFVLWARTGHIVQQEYKAAVLDLLDVLACPTDEYTGLSIEDKPQTANESQTMMEQPSYGVVAASEDPIDPRKLSNNNNNSSSSKKSELILQLRGAAAAAPSDEAKATLSEDNVTEQQDPVRPVGINEDMLNNMINAAFTSCVPQTVDAALLDEDSISLQPSQWEQLESDNEADGGSGSPVNQYLGDEDEGGEDGSVMERRVPFEAESPASSIASLRQTMNKPVVAMASAPAPHPQQPKYNKKPTTRIIELDEEIQQAEKDCELIEFKIKRVKRQLPETTGTEHEQKMKELSRLSKDLSLRRKDIHDMIAEQRQIDPLKDYWDSKEIINYHTDPVPELQGMNARSLVSPLSLPLDAAVPAPGNGTLQQHFQPARIADHDQRNRHQWISQVPDAATALALEAELQAKQREYLALEEKIRHLRAQTADPATTAAATEPNTTNANPLSAMSSARVTHEDEQEDVSLLTKLASELERRQREREFAEKQRRVEIRSLEDKLVHEGILPPYDGPVDQFPGSSSPTSAPTSAGLVVSTSTAQEVVGHVPAAVTEMPPTHYQLPAPLPRVVTEGRDLVSKLDQMKADELEARKRGLLSMEDFEQVKSQMAARQLERDEMLRTLTAQELAELEDTCAIKIQTIVRGFVARKRCRRLDALRQLQRHQQKNAVHLQRIVRAFLGRRRFRRIKLVYLQNMKGFHSATLIQKRFRGYHARLMFLRMLRRASAIKIQRVFRGHLGRQAVARERLRLQLLQGKHRSAAKIQSIWRMKVSREEYRSLRIHILAAIELQRMFRGYLGRKKMARRRQWESTKPGPERIKLGLQFIEESKQAFERQQEEIDALHRAQERAEARISHIHAELKDSEKELVILERELQEIDQIERDLQVLTHERQVLAQGIEDAAGMPRTAAKGHPRDLVLGRESVHDTDPMLERRKRAEAYALEMTIQLKRAEREKKRQELEIEFAAVFAEVEKKKKALQRLELSLADMESTRERKDREFRRLQKNLMQLLLEQKHELDALREKGLELETATATTAAAAVATAQKAKEHEQRSQAMFSQTEELMKFQFMSMSLSYFSSLNMLKSLRDMNADTTSAAIALSADAAATAASVATAANLPNIKKLNMGTNDFIEAAIRKKKEELAVSDKAKKELAVVTANPLPENVRTWTVNDVVRWLDSLSLSQYAASFQEGSVDGPFLMELREEDLIQVLGIRHKLHVRKILISREKLKPLSQQEQQQYQTVVAEDQAKQLREEVGVPTLDTVFSQARNGRIKRVEESINLGFMVETEDERGNTLLIVAAQNRNKKLVEMLLLRGANINHQNAAGNTALHYAIALDPEGSLAEYLIEHGADDTIENVDGLTPYDGVSS
jgi:pimeloyl-ACP methyl ester carboxylesterase